MKIFFTIISVLCCTIGLVQAQNTLVYQDFSSGTSLSDFIGSGSTQLPWGFASPNIASSAGLMTPAIVNQKLQIDLRSGSSEYEVFPAAAGFNYNIGSAVLVKLHFKVNYEQISDGNAPKPLVVWINNNPVLFLGTDSNMSYFVSNPGAFAPYFSDGGASTIWYNGAASNRLTGEHLVTAILNFSDRDASYNSENFPSYSMKIYLDGVFQNLSNWRSGRNYIVDISEKLTT